MKLKPRAIYRWVLLIALLILSLYAIRGQVHGNYVFQERMQVIAEPSDLWGGFIRREWQPYLEQQFLLHTKGLRAYLILSYNEVKHRLFPTRPNNAYLWTPELGYYPVDTVRRLNGDVLHHDAIAQHYQQAAHRLSILQKMLAHHGVSLLMVIPPPKVRVYPEYVASYLVAPPQSVMSHAVSYGDMLEASGVNVLNVQRAFTEKKASAAWPFFATTGFHWNYWAACNETDALLRKAEALSGHAFFGVNCADVEYAKSKWTDTDIAAILNIRSSESLLGETPFPKIVPQKEPAEEAHKIVILGDSYSDQIVYALTRALPEMSWSPGWLTRYDSFVSRQSFGMEGKVTAQTPLQRDAVLSEILSKELFVMEISDGNISRDNLQNMEFGATQVLLEGLLSKQDIAPIDYVSSGWRAETNKAYRTTGTQAGFVVRRPASGHVLQVALDVQNMASDLHKSRTFDVLVDGKKAVQISLLPGQRRLEITLPDTTQWQDPLVGEIALQDVSEAALDLRLLDINIAGASKVKQSVSAAISTVSPLKIQTIDLISRDEPEDVLVEGLSGLESNDKESWRWATGAATRIKFYGAQVASSKPRQRLLKLAFKNGASIPDQTVTVRLNGKDVKYFSAAEIALHEVNETVLLLSPRKGINVLELVYHDWNHGKKDYAAHDSRQLAVVVMRLVIDAFPNR